MKKTNSTVALFSIIVNHLVCQSLFSQITREWIARYGEKIKTIFTVIVIIFIGAVNLYSQQIMNSTDVKIKAPLKSSWEYKTNSTLLNKKISGNICYVNTLMGIQAISLNDGKQIWNYDFPKDKSISSVVTFSDKYGVYINYKKNNSCLTLIDLSTGKEKWNLKSKKVWYKPAAMLNDNYVVCLNGPPIDWNKLSEYFDMKLDDSRLTAFKIDDGKPAWETLVDDNESDLLKVTKDYVFVSFDFKSTGPTNKILCFKTKDGKQKWEYNPSGMMVPVMIGGIQVFNNDLYTFPIHGGNGQLARVDVNSGDEKWNINIAGQRNFILQNNNIYNCSKAWQCVNPGTGDKLLDKSLIKFSFSVGDFFSGMASSIFSDMFANSYLGLLIVSVYIVTDIPGLFSEGEGSEPVFIPTQFLFYELHIEDVANDKGLFSVIRNEDEVKFVSMNLNDDDDKETEKIFPKNANDLCLSNGTNESSIFASSRGKLFSIRIQDSSIEWEKDFSNGAKETSLGLILNQDKMYLFTDKKLCQLVSE